MQTALWYGWTIETVASAITITVNDSPTAVGGATLQAAITDSGVAATEVTSLNITAGSVTNFGTGTVSVAIHYTLQKGEIAGGLCVVYVDGDGKVSYITNSSYDAEAKILISQIPDNRYTPNVNGTQKVRQIY